MRVLPAVQRPARRSVSFRARPIAIAMQPCAHRQGGARQRQWCAARRGQLAAAHLSGTHHRTSFPWNPLNKRAVRLPPCSAPALPGDGSERSGAANDAAEGRARPGSGVQKNMRKISMMSKKESFIGLVLIAGVVSADYLLKFFGVSSLDRRRSADAPPGVVPVPDLAPQAESDVTDVQVVAPEAPAPSSAVVSSAPAARPTLVRGPPSASDILKGDPDGPEEEALGSSTWPSPEAGPKPAQPSSTVQAASSTAAAQEKSAALPASAAARPSAGIARDAKGASSGAEARKPSEPRAAQASFPRTQSAASASKPVPADPKPAASAATPTPDSTPPQPAASAAKPTPATKPPQPAAAAAKPSPATKPLQPAASAAKPSPATKPPQLAASPAKPTPASTPAAASSPPAGPPPPVSTPPPPAAVPAPPVNVAKLPPPVRPDLVRAAGAPVALQGAAAGRPQGSDTGPGSGGGGGEGAGGSGGRGGGGGRGGDDGPSEGPSGDGNGGGYPWVPVLLFLAAAVTYPIARYNAGRLAAGTDSDSPPGLLHAVKEAVAQAQRAVHRALGGELATEVAAPIPSEAISELVDPVGAAAAFKEAQRQAYERKAAEYQASRMRQKPGAATGSSAGDPTESSTNSNMRWGWIALGVTALACGVVVLYGLRPSKSGTPPAANGRGQAVASTSAAATTSSAQQTPRALPYPTASPGHAQVAGFATAAAAGLSAAGMHKDAAGTPPGGARRDRENMPDGQADSSSRAHRAADVQPLTPRSASEMNRHKANVDAVRQDVQRLRAQLMQTSKQHGAVSKMTEELKQHGEQYGRRQEEELGVVQEGLAQVAQVRQSLLERMHAPSPRKDDLT